MPEPSPPALLVRILNKWQMLLAQNSFIKEQTKRKNWRDSTTDSPATLSVFRNCIHNIFWLLWTLFMESYFMNHKLWTISNSYMNQKLLICIKCDAIEDHFWIYTKDLERENKILEAQLNQLKSRGPSNLAEKYEEELRRLRQMVDKLTHERAQAEMLRDNYANESEQWHEKYDEELVSIHIKHMIWSKLVDKWSKINRFFLPVLVHQLTFYVQHSNHKYNSFFRPKEKILKPILTKWERIAMMLPLSALTLNAKLKPWLKKWNSSRRFTQT